MLLTNKRRMILKAEREVLERRTKDRIRDALLLGRTLAGESMSFAEIQKWRAIDGKLAEEQRPYIGTELEGFTIESINELRSFLKGVGEVAAEIDREPSKEELSEEEKDARDKANGWKVIDPEGAERRVQERREARRAEIANYQRRKAAGEDVEYPA
jgi:hypothetical protein